MYYRHATGDISGARSGHEDRSRGFPLSCMSFVMFTRFSLQLYLIFVCCYSLYMYAFVLLPKTETKRLRLNPQCYFLQSADASVPIIYYVDRVRQGTNTIRIFYIIPVLIFRRAGKTFTTRGIKALQRGKPVFILLASFSKLELGHPFAQWTMPTDIKPPEQCQDQADKILEWANAAESTDRKAHLLQLRQVRTVVNPEYCYFGSVNPSHRTPQDRILSPVEIRVANEDSGSLQVNSTCAKYWMRARNIPKYEASFQKV